MTGILLIITAIIAIFTIGFVIGNFACKVNGAKCDCAETVKDEKCADCEVAPAVDTADVADLVIGDIDDEDDTFAFADAPRKSISFAKRILEGSEQSKAYFVAIQDEFYSLRGVNVRISSKGVSYRLGRELIAKLFVRGKTLRLNLALSVADYSQSVYFQKDMSDVKAYQQIPFGVKVKSDRGLKNALKLVGELCQKRSIAKKVRYNKKDALAELKAKA